MATNGTYPVCSENCRDPNTWKRQIATGCCGLIGLAILGTVSDCLERRKIMSKTRGFEQK
ncbi:uncharacterized protein N7518_007701 [Penicillium psychrosexuale]|uniref:uncharacterized protein n=1 Tax=Penicillium psychrosexuale TaxID=1002107 RepID=UPI0025450E3E|nr:uncharacterized protein N7518_007701 [Penicillium psychrosexuale]KAJ5790690.1 hypothetical protein N7518_007701 [Penicillium psychrosexuale]